MLLTFAILFTACSSTTLNYSWRDPDYRERIHKVYIVGLTHVNISRYRFEDFISRELQARGVTAIPSYKDGEFPVAVDDQTINERIVANNADSLLMARVISEYGGQDGFETVIVEVTLYDARKGKPIWSGQYKITFDQKTEKLLSDLAKAFASDLQKNGII
jgi:hypothetical protein